MATLKTMEFKGKLAALMMEYDVVMVRTPMGSFFASETNKIYLSVDKLAEELNDQ